MSFEPGALFQGCRYISNPIEDIIYYIKLILSYTDDNMLFYSIRYCTILYYTILYYTILYYTILYYTILYSPMCIILYHAITKGFGFRLRAFRRFFLGVVLVMWGL